MYRSKGLEKSGRAKKGAKNNFSFSKAHYCSIPQIHGYYYNKLKIGKFTKKPKNPIVLVRKSQELLQFLDVCRVRPVLHRPHFFLIYLQFATGRLNILYQNFFDKKLAWFLAYYIKKCFIIFSIQLISLQLDIWAGSYIG